MWSFRICTPYLILLDGKIKEYELHETKEMKKVYEMSSEKVNGRDIQRSTGRKTSLGRSTLAIFTEDCKSAFQDGPEHADLLTCY
jgi:hypothetical protein